MSNFQATLKQYRTQTTQVESTAALIASTKEELVVLKRTEEYFTQLKHSHITSNKEFIETTINRAIQSVFRINYKIEIQIVPPSGRKKSSTYKINYYQNDNLIADNTRIKANDGGSILSYISFLFKIIINRILGNDIVLLDEDLSQVSKNYLPAISKVIRDITENYQMTIIVITHDMVLTELAHTVYELGSVQQAKFSRLFIDEVHVDPTNDDNQALSDCPLFRLHVEGFQTMEMFDADFQGFVCITGKGRTGKSAIFRSIKSVVYADFNAGFSRDGKRNDTKIQFARVFPDNTKVQSELHYDKVKNKINMTTETRDGDRVTYVGIQKAKAPIMEFSETQLGIHTPELAQFKTNTDMKKALSNIILDSQFDSTMVVGANSGELDRLFETLFNTSAIVNAMNECISEKDDVLLLLAEANIKHGVLVDLLTETSSELISSATEAIVTLDSLIEEHRDYRPEVNVNLQLQLDYKLLLEHQIGILALELDLITIDEAEESFVNSSIKLQHLLLELTADKAKLLGITKELGEKQLLLNNYARLGALSESLPMFDKIITTIDRPNVEVNNLKEKLTEAKHKLQDHNHRYSIRKCSVCDGDGSVVHDTHTH